ncbi:MAG: hypothetical protein O2944_07305 [Proteobacteria bacterium]|nr:hypothetical protein [Pseudomonadota bacterium]
MPDYGCHHASQKLKPASGVIKATDPVITHHWNAMLELATPIRNPIWDHGGCRLTLTIRIAAIIAVAVIALPTVAGTDPATLQLLRAVTLGDLRLIRTCLAFGADPAAAGQDGASAFDIARLSGRPELLEMLSTPIGLGESDSDDPFDPDVRIKSTVSAKSKPPPPPVPALVEAISKSEAEMVAAETAREPAEHAAPKVTSDMTPTPTQKATGTANSAPAPKSRPSRIKISIELIAPTDISATAAKTPADAPPSETAIATAPPATVAQARPGLLDRALARFRALFLPAPGSTAAEPKPLEASEATAKAAAPTPQAPAREEIDLPRRVARRFDVFDWAKPTGSTPADRTTAVDKSSNRP